MGHRTTRLFVLLLILLLVGVVSEWQRIRPVLQSKPLAEPENICFPSSGADDAESLSAADFRSVEKVRDLPEPIVRRFTELGGRRLTIVNPGKDFEMGDSISDNTRPRRRLVFAAVSKSITVLEYERGGWGMSYIAEAYKTDKSALHPLWQRYCPQKARNVQELKALVISGECRPAAQWNQGSSPCTP